MKMVITSVGMCATLVNSIYKYTGKNSHCDQIRVEALGKILFIDKAKTYGKFKSKTRGYIKYDLATDTFSKLDLNNEHIVEKEKKELKVSTVFGDGYLLTELLKNSQIFSPLKATFCKNKVFERVFIHILHSLGKCGQDIDCCDYARKSFLSYIIPDIGLSSLETDTAYFKFMADPNIKLEFFKNFIAEMRKTNKDFGKVCYLDSTPIPNEVKSMMLNYFCTHGTNTAAMQVRLALLLDEETGYPVWFDVIPGNVTDGNTLINMFDYVTEELELEVNDLVLDCGYCTKENLLHFKSGSLANFLVRMSDRKGYSMDTMYYRHFPEFIQAKYSFVRQGHSYYGRRVEKELWGEKFYAFIYVDKFNAQVSFTHRNLNL